MPRTRYLKAKIGDAHVTVEALCSPGSLPSFDDPGDPPEIDIVAVVLDITGNTIKLAERALGQLYDQLYETYEDDDDT